jgi:hypothetical protein
MKNNRYPEQDPRHHAVNIQEMLDKVAQHCREDAAKIREPKAQALCEATAEVLGGLKTTWLHYETRAEAALTP